MKDLKRDKDGDPIFDDVARTVVRSIFPIMHGDVIRTALEQAYQLGWNDAKTVPAGKTPSEPDGAA